MQIIAQQTQQLRQRFANIHTFRKSRFFLKGTTYGLFLLSSKQLDYVFVLTRAAKMKKGQVYVEYTRQSVNKFA